MTTALLYRLAGWTGVVAMVGTLVNVARRAGFVPVNALTHAIAPPAAALSVVVLVAVFLYQRERLGRLGLVGFGLNLFGLIGLFGVEFATHAVFQFLDPDELTALLAGPTRGYLLAVAGTFLVGVVLFGVAQLRARMLPAAALVLYLVGFVPASLRGIVPDPVYLGGLAVGAIGTLWLSLALVRAVSEPRPTSAAATRAAPGNVGSAA